MRRREIPEINAGSMADIAFLLLIFFLVATTMDIDSGIHRVLPQPTPEDFEPPEVKERNVLPVLVNLNDQLMVKGEVTQLSDLKEKVREFLLNVDDDEELPEKRIEEIEFFGEMEVTKGIISLQTDKGTSYKAFVEVLNEITAAGNEIKNEFSLEHFGDRFDELPSDKRKAVLNAVPCVISEAEPKNISQH
jgi:biopolymer transport protein ExbD